MNFSVIVLTDGRNMQWDSLNMSRWIFLSPSGDLGIGLVWDNLSWPHPTGPQLFGPTVEILFKLN